MSKEKLDKAGDLQGLTDNPFGALAGLKGALPDTPPPAPAMPVAEIVRPKADVPFHIQRTRKGGMPLSLEKRPGGKVATLIGNVHGDADALLALLKKKCGAGGVVRENAVEIQGDHRSRIEVI
ncbi:MAG: translation initiation factor, partial [Candidatus Hydrogenedentes bacterium]|nr:translation initiation factor [Candidatus Hydrogenedentota bacterium]